MSVENPFKEIGSSKTSGDEDVLFCHLLAEFYPQNLADVLLTLGAYLLDIISPILGCVPKSSTCPWTHLNNDRPEHWQVTRNKHLFPFSWTNRWHQSRHLFTNRSENQMTESFISWLQFLILLIAFPSKQSDLKRTCFQSASNTQLKSGLQK